jgi:hypothetical protein
VRIEHDFISPFVMRKLQSGLNIKYFLTGEVQVRLTKSGKKQGKILLQLKSSSLGSSSNLANEEDAKGPVEAIF